MKTTSSADQGQLILVDSRYMERLMHQLLTLILSFSGSFLLVSQAQATCFGSQGQIICHDNLTGNIYNSRVHRPPSISSPRIKHRFGWMPMQSQRKLNSLTITEGYTAGRKRWKTYGRVDPNGDYRIIGSDPRGPVQRTCINRKCF